MLWRPSPVESNSHDGGSTPLTSDLLDPFGELPEPPPEFRDPVPEKPERFPGTPEHVPETLEHISRRSSIGTADAARVTKFNSGFVRRSIAAFNTGRVEKLASDEGFRKGFALDENGFLKSDPIRRKSSTETTSRVKNGPGPIAPKPILPPLPIQKPTRPLPVPIITLPSPDTQKVNDLDKAKDPNQVKATDNEVKGQNKINEPIYANGNIQLTDHQKNIINSILSTSGPEVLRDELGYTFVNKPKKTSPSKESDDEHNYEEIHFEEGKLLSKSPSPEVKDVSPNTEHMNNLRKELEEVIKRSMDNVPTPTGPFDFTPIEEEKKEEIIPKKDEEEEEEDMVVELRKDEPRTILEGGFSSRKSALACEECASDPSEGPSSVATPLTPSPLTPTPQCPAPGGLRSLFRQCACASPLISPRKPRARPAAAAAAVPTAKWYVKPTWRLWGEERTPGAIYTVYLKKVRYHRPTRTISAQDSDDEISHLEWETVRVRFVKAGTLEKLVESLATDDGELESTYINVFLATYRTFATADHVLNLLLDRYEQLARCDEDNTDGTSILDQHRKTLVLALYVWLDSYPEDFRDPPQHPGLQQLLMFCRQHLPDSELEVKVRYRLDKFNRDDQMLDSCNIFTGSPAAPVCSSPHNTLVSGGSPNKQPFTFPDVPETHFAEQLTRMDMELFKKLVPHQCLGAVWSRRDKNRSQEAATVLATVNQFNAVSFRVISTVLVDPDLRPVERAKIITTWIDIAQELRVLKNFSSLKAIISGLQSNPVYRLQRTWQAVSREKVELYEELARIFSEDNNQWAQRELLMREGTAKFADTAGHNDRQLQKVFQKQLNNSRKISHGTIPYLGTFLTDLTMIDTAIPDMVGEDMINFDKRRKEFEVLAQIKLLQGAANAYNISHDPAFDCWFDSLLVLDDREAYQLSCQIEPPSSGTIGSTGTSSRDARHKKRSGLGHRKNDSIASTSSSSSSQFYCDLDSLPSSPHNSLDRKASPSQMSSSSSSSSLRSLDVSVSSSNHSNSTTRNQAHPPHLNAQLNPTAAQLNNPLDFYIIRVTVEADGPETEGVIMYKSIMLSNNERTPQVIRNAMLKLGIEGNPDSYSLSQVLPEKEMILPPNANVYYAVNTQFNLNFILRNKVKIRKDVEPVPPNRTKFSRRLIANT